MQATFTRTTRSVGADSPRIALFCWGLAALIMAAWGTWFCLVRITVFEVSQDARLEVETVAQPLAVATAGKVAACHTQIGAEVQAGQLLIEMDGTEDRLLLAEETARLTALPAQILALKKEIAAQESVRTEDQHTASSAVAEARARFKEATAAASFARDHAQRLTLLGKSGRIPLIDALRTSAEAKKLAATQEALMAAIQRAGNEAKTRGYQHSADIEDRRRQIAFLDGQLQTTQATIAHLEQKLRKNIIRAPVSGRVADLKPLATGSYVKEGETLATLVPGGDLKIVADFPPAAVMGRIRQGQNARMRLDGFPWAQYGAISAQVTRVGSEVRNQKVRVEFMPRKKILPGLRLQHGLTGTIEVEIEHTTPALLALRAAGQKLSTPVVSSGAAEPAGSS